jgi:DNA repair protein RadC
MITSCERWLFTAQPRRDMKPPAKSRLKTLGAFAEAVHAPEARLREVNGVSATSRSTILD